MPRETIRKLSEDVGALLVAGGHLAPGDPGLARDKDALGKLAAQLGDKAPVIGQLGAAVGQVLGAQGKDATRELVTLATRVAQVRAAQAQPAPASDDGRPLVAVPPLGTPCNAKDLDDLYEALVHKGQGRMEIINRAIESGAIADLRLVEALIHAMADPYIGDLVSEQAIPRLGRALIAPIRGRLNLRGKAVDGRRLKALVAVEKAEARDLLGQALREGSADVREAALDAIADHVQGIAEFEPLALEAIEKERSGDVRRAAVRALAGYGSDQSLAALLDAIEVDATRLAASEALGRSRHPEAVRRMLAMLTEALATKPKPAKKDDPKAKAAQERAKQKRQEIVAALLQALAGQKDPAIAAAGLELVPEFGAVAAHAVVGSGDRGQLATIADLLDGDDDGLFPVAASAARALGPDEAWKRLTAPWKAKDRTTQRGQARLAVIAELVDPAEQRWVDFLIQMVSESPVVAQYAIGPLGAARDRRATRPLLKLLEGDTKRDKQLQFGVAVVHALGRIGDPAAVDPILALVNNRQYAMQAAIRNAISDIGDRGSVAKVREIFVTLKNPDDWSNWHIKHLLRSLEERFPGA
jgi:HEAT repeat protein